MMINILTKANPVSSEKWNNFKAFIRPYFGQQGIRLANELPGMKLPLDYKVSNYLKRLLFGRHARNPERSPNGMGEEASA